VMGLDFLKGVREGRKGTRAVYLTETIFPTGFGLKYPCIQK